jgi:hypothetical protein
MNTIAQQIKDANKNDLSALIFEAEDKGEVTQDWENESTRFNFEDGSSLAITNAEVTISR